MLTSDFEGFGNVLVESLICGTPAISTDCPSGPSGILSGALADCLVPVDDEQAFAEKIKAVYFNPPLIDSCCYQAFTAETIAQQYLQLTD